MPQVIIFLDNKEDKIVEKFAKEWKLSKHETIKRLIKREVENGFWNGQKKEEGRV